VPLTLQFGPWSPDLANVPVQAPDTQGPVVIPCADCLNVFYANGAYQSMASPAAATIDGNTVAALTNQAVGAFSYFDNVQQQETIFVGTSGGIQQLATTGFWNTVPFVTQLSVSVSGLSLTFVAGPLPNTDRLIGVATSFTLGTVTIGIEGTVIIAALLTEQGYGSPHGGGVIESQTVGYRLGAQGGTLVSTNLPIGAVVQLSDFISGGYGQSATFSLSVTPDPGATAYTQITANGTTQLFASATYSWTTGVSTWVFPKAFGLAAGTTYAVTVI
jgi:hypothetical protein